MKLEAYYENRRKEFSDKASHLKQQIFYNSLIRVAIFVIGVCSIYYFHTSGSIVLISFILSAAIFLFFVKRQVDLKKEYAHHQALQEINEKELHCLKFQFKSFDSGEDLKVSEHPYCLDIDVFGKGSIFQYINRTVLPPARRKLGAHLLANSIEDVDARQNIVKQLSVENDWCQQFLAEAKSIKSDVTEEGILDWLQHYSYISTGIFQFLPFILSGISILGFIAFIIGVIPEGVLMILLLIGLFFSSLKLKEINKTAAKMASAHDMLEQYSKLVYRIENKTFHCDIPFDQSGVSPKIKRFSSLLNSLNQRNNIMISIFANGFFLRDIWLCSKIDKWVKNNKNEVSVWFQTLHDYDRYISLGIFAFNHAQQTSYPLIAEEKGIMAAALGHPLLPEQQRVSNDFTILKNQFFVITGANMAGKSTFLRTVGLSIVLANSGLPICATSFRYKPIKLISSMRTSDSLSENESYFFSELKRLQYIVKEIKQDEYFIILDEILKGTNSKDKAEGSEKFLTKLSKTKSTGIIATHDLSLCKVADTIDSVENKYFDAEIKDDELFFDYTLKEGVCKNMNASFLMRKMGIVDN